LQPKRARIFSSFDVLPPLNIPLYVPTPQSPTSSLENNNLSSIGLLTDSSNSLNSDNSFDDSFPSVQFSVTDGPEVIDLSSPLLRRGMMTY
jgi:hypothetical protein